MRRVRDNDAAFACGGIDIPSEILLDRDGKAGVECALNAIAPTSLIRIAVMRVEDGLVVI
jgi:hypothetical protein